MKKTFIFCFIILSTCSPHLLRAQARDIWICPQASIPPSPLNRAVDFMQMFAPDAPWEKAASHTRVFKLYSSFVNPASQGQIDTVVADLKKRDIPIALEVGVIDVNFRNPVPPCGGFGLVEGYGTPAMALNICAKIKKAGGRISYLCMDEPLFYGHYFTKRAPNGQPGCHSPIPQIMGLSIPTLNTFIQQFPDIVIGEVEPTQIAAFPGWQDSLHAWAQAFQSAIGKPLAFLHLDIPWANRPPSSEPSDALAFYQYAQSLKKEHLLDKIGIIFNGTPLDTTDAAWMQDARNHVIELQNKYKLHPDQAIIQSWMPHPTHAMPDRNPDALTSLVNFYVEQSRW